MENLIKKYESVTKELFGNRVNGAQKCIFCGAFVNTGEYCKCKKALQVNRYFKKVSTKIDNIKNISGLYTKFETTELMKRFYTIPPRFEGLDFSSYKTECREQKKVLYAVVEYYQNSIKNFLIGTNLILLGNYGTGKTMLMSILCDLSAENYYFQNRFINAVDLVNKIKDTFSDTSTQSALKMADKYKDIDYLYLDDIDKINPTDYVRELMYSIVNYRIEHELPIVVSANNSLEVLDDKYFGEAVISRLIENSVIVRFTQKNMRYE